MGAAKQTNKKKKKGPRSASLDPPAGAAKSLARGQSRQQQRGRGGRRRAQPRHSMYMGLVFFTDANEREKRKSQNVFGCRTEPRLCSL